MILSYRNHVITFDSQNNPLAEQVLNYREKISRAESDV